MECGTERLAVIGSVIIFAVIVAPPSCGVVTSTPGTHLPCNRRRLLCITIVCLVIVVVVVVSRLLVFVRVEVVGIVGRCRRRRVCKCIQSSPFVSVVASIAPVSLPAIAAIMDDSAIAG